MLVNRFSGFTTRSDTNRPVQVQKMDRSLKYPIEDPCSEKKGADLRLCFCIGKIRFSYNAAQTDEYYK